ncbi:hypothetical protein P4E94_07370 [Pontiellaceae bacterium B12219]|nr:hypothetical protein [Pontiellaceae bacterium B12219]
MKRFLSILFLILMALRSQACGPLLPPTYLGDYNGCFVENINVAEELELIALEYALIGSEHYSQGSCSTLEAERLDFSEKAAHFGGLEYVGDFTAYATAVRAGNTNALAPPVPEPLEEFVLYLEGTQQFRSEPDMLRPPAWDKLLAMDLTNRLYRSTWVNYMLGNLASGHGRPELASEYYAACRASARETGTDQSIGLAHASFKRDYLAQTNLALRIKRGIAAIGYYHKTRDRKREKFCMDHLQLDMQQAARESLDQPSMSTLEAMALFQVGQAGFSEKLEQYPELKITPRLAWFMYKNGKIEKAAAYLEQCPKDDILSNWLRFRLAQRQGQNETAIAHLKCWMDSLQQSDRIVFELAYDSVSSRSALNGSLGMLYASQGQMMDAMLSFIQAGAYRDAALIAERYLATEELMRYVNTFENRASYASAEAFQLHYQAETYIGTIELRLSYLLARRLFREGRPTEALPYYPPEIARILTTYLSAKNASEKFWSTPNVRSAHLYHAARIMRWKGMELSGTEFYPDYTVEYGDFSWAGIQNEDHISPADTTPAYADTAPVPNVRFHYRHIAAALAAEAAAYSWNRHQKALLLWSAGSWIQNRHPQEADVYYKKLARIRFQPLAKAADKKRWFPEASPMMDYIYRSEDYIETELIVKTAKGFKPVAFPN